MALAGLAGACMPASPAGAMCMSVAAGAGMPIGGAGCMSAALSMAQTWGDLKVGYKLKYVGSAPLLEDRSIESDSVINSDLYFDLKLNKDLSLNLSIFNLLDRDNSDIQYAQDYFLAGGPAFGKTFHPSLPRNVRLTANYRF